MAGRAAQFQRAHQIREREALLGVIRKEIEDRHNALNAGRSACHGLRIQDGKQAIMPESPTPVRSTARPGKMEFVIAEFVFANFISPRSEEHTSELQSLMRISYAFFC